MPANCPKLFGEPTTCYGCRSRDKSECRGQLPWVPLRDILTPEERMDLLEAWWEEIRYFTPSYVLAEIRKDLNSITGEIRHFEQQFTDHIAPDKRKKLQKQTKSKGTVDV